MLKGPVSHHEDFAFYSDEMGSLCRILAEISHDLPHFFKRTTAAVIMRVDCRESKAGTQEQSGRSLQ